MTSTNTSGATPFHLGLRAAVRAVESFSGWFADGYAALAKQEADAAIDLLRGLPGVVDPTEVGYLTALLGSGKPDQIDTAFAALAASEAVLKGALAYVEMRRLFGESTGYGYLPAVRFMAPAPDQASPAKRPSLEAVTEITSRTLRDLQKDVLRKEDEESAFAIFRDHTDRIEETSTVEDLMNILESSPIDILFLTASHIRRILREPGDPLAQINLITNLFGARAQFERLINSGQAARFRVLEGERQRHARTYPLRSVALSILEDTRTEIKKARNREELREALEGSLIDDGSALADRVEAFLDGKIPIDRVTEDLGLRDKAFQLRENAEHMRLEMIADIRLLSLLPAQEAQELIQWANRLLEDARRLSQDKAPNNSLKDILFHLDRIRKTIERILRVLNDSCIDELDEEEKRLRCAILEQTHQDPSIILNYWNMAHLLLTGSPLKAAGNPFEEMVTPQDILLRSIQQLDAALLEASRVSQLGRASAYWEATEQNPDEHVCRIFIQGHGACDLNYVQGMIQMLDGHERLLKRWFEAKMRLEFALKSPPV